MIKETVAIAWKDDVSVHLVPELPDSIENRIKHTLPDWKIFSRSDDYTTLRSESQNASIVSGSKETKAMCIGIYGENFKSIKAIGEAIKKVAKVSKRDDILTKLRERTCEASISCEAIPIKVKHIATFTYQAVPERNLTVVGYAGTFYQFSNNFYKHEFSKKPLEFSK